MALISWIVPRTLLACVQVTRAVFSDNRGRRLSTVKIRSCGGDDGVHHFKTKPRTSAIRTHADILASWSIDETMISAFGGKSIIKERLAKSCVVDGPMTGDNCVSYKEVWSER